MRICLMLAAVLALGSSASVAERGRPTAILVSPIDQARIVRADDGKDHVEYELLVVNVFSEPVTLASVTVFDPAGKELMRIEGGFLAAATQTLFAKTATSVVPASAAVSVDVDLILPLDTAPERVTHRIAYTLKADSELALMVGSLEVNAPEGSRPGIPNVFRAPFQSDAAHHSNLMAPRVVSSRRPVRSCHNGCRWVKRQCAVGPALAESASLHGTSIPAVAAWRLDLGECARGRDRRSPRAPRPWGAAQAVRQRAAANRHTRPGSPAARWPRHPNAEGGCVDRPAGGFGSRRAAAGSIGERDSEPGARRCSARARQLWFTDLSAWSCSPLRNALQ